MEAFVFGKLGAVVIQNVLMIKCKNNFILINRHSHTWLFFSFNSNGIHLLNYFSYQTLKQIKTATLKFVANILTVFKTSLIDGFNRLFFLDWNLCIQEKREKKDLLVISVLQFFHSFMDIICWFFICHAIPESIRSHQ